MTNYPRPPKGIPAMTVTPDLLTRIQTERWTPVTEQAQQEWTDAHVDRLLTEAIHLINQALNERKLR